MEADRSEMLDRVMAMPVSEFAAHVRAYAVNPNTIAVLMECVEHVARNLAADEARALPRQRRVVREMRVGGKS